MADINASYSAKSRAIANLALSFDPSVPLRDIKRNLRNGSGTVPCFDPGFLLEMGASLFEGCKVMNGYFLSPLLLCKIETLGYGDKKIEQPFHGLDCGVCILFACLVREALTSKFYQHDDFVKIHNNVSRRLLINQVDVKEDLPKNDFAAYKYVKLDGHSFWVVQAYRGYSAALNSGSRWADKVKPLVERVLPKPTLLAEEPCYSAVSPPVSPEPKKRAKVGKKKKVAELPEASGEDERKVEPPKPIRAVKPLRGVLDDSDSD